MNPRSAINVRAVYSSTMNFFANRLNGRLAAYGKLKRARKRTHFAPESAETGLRRTSC